MKRIQKYYKTNFITLPKNTKYDCTQRRCKNTKTHSNYWENRNYEACMNKTTEVQHWIWLAEPEMILVVWECWLQGGKVNPVGLFQDIWKSAGRGKSWVVSRMRISVDMCSVTHDARGGGWQLHIQEILRKKVGWRHCTSWRRWGSKQGKGQTHASYHEHNAAPCVRLFIKI